jgi:hypothetical protein
MGRGGSLADLRSWWIGVRGGCIGGGVFAGQEICSAVGAGGVEDDVDGFLFDGGDGAEELAGNVGEDGGAAGGDFVLGEKEEQAREEVVDLGGGGEVVEVGGEGGGGFCGVGAVVRQVGVAGTEAGGSVGRCRKHECSGQRC